MDGKDESTQPPSYVVGIGASAGGLDALERFFDNLPPSTGMAFVVIQHLSPDFKSLMDELLARHTQLPIHLVEDGMPVVANHVYLIPAKKEMIISGGRLLLSERDRFHELTLPIDVFFRSLAQDCGPRAVAIVLSGSGSDGSRGIRDVREAGGLVIVQDPGSAQFDGMPRMARESGVANWVLAPQDMPRVLLEHAARTPPTSEVDAIEEPPERRGIGALYRMLEEEFGLDFTHYKPSTVTRRIERRLGLAQTQDIEHYVERLKKERDELDRLYQDLLIGVTRFFRDKEAFQLLETKILPELFIRTPRDIPVRIWVAGCATGEEVYSFAIVLSELMAKMGERPVKIFATDVHRGSLERAVRAIYDEQAVAGVSPERLARYFRRAGSTYQVIPELRQMIVFAHHNVIRDAPFTRVDLISCRNLLIYLQPAAQQKVLSLFHFALNRGGILFLGPSETAGPLARDFETLDKHWHVYRKTTEVRTTVDPRLHIVGTSQARLGVGTVAASGRPSLAQLLGTYDELLDELMPPSILVTDRGELVHSFAGASRFLRFRDGRQALDVVDLVDTELKMVLVGGLKRALNEPSAIVFRGVQVRDGNGEGTYRVSIRRVRGRHGGPPHLLISFEPSETRSAARLPATETEVDVGQISRDQLSELEAELTHTKENLQAAIEELETSNEELQAANEELQASNEELQSTNEELQSVNEELYTVNAEYQRKIAELVEVTNDMDNLLASTEVGTIFLDRGLRIRRFTPQVAETFNLMAQDVGRPISNFAHKMQHPGLVKDLEGVLASGQPVERELRDPKGGYVFLRILPYRNRGIVDGVVLTMIDVSGLKAAEDALFHERYLLNSLLLSVQDAIYFKDARGKFIRANEGMARRLGIEDPTLAVGKTARDFLERDAAASFESEDEEVLRTGQAQHDRLEQWVGPDGAPGWNLVTRLPLRDRSGQIVGVIGIFRDFTEQKRAAEKIEEGVRRRDQFLAMLSHELRNPLGAIVTATAMLKREGDTQVRRDRLLGVLNRQSEQMAHLLDDLLEASRVTQNRIELKRQLVDLGAVACDAVDAVRGQLEAREIELILELGEQPIYVDGDPSRLQQIQVNLLSNAIKYTPVRGHVRLLVAREGEHAVIRVKDDGVGIPNDLLESVFDLFVQSRRTLDRSAGGLGVGLTIVRSLVTMHGGTVTASSDGEGQGAEFVVRLPLADKARAEHAPIPVVGEPLVVRRRPRIPERAKVMIVEDNADSREMMCEVLEAVGFDCRTAGSGPDALALLDEISPHIAVLDVGLPGIDGFELARRIRASVKHAGMYLVAVTGYGQSSDRAAAREAGFDEHLVKPVQVDQLVQKLKELRGGPASDVQVDRGSQIDGRAQGAAIESAGE